MHKTSFNPVPFPFVKCISWKGKDSQKMHKKTESKISRPKHQQSTPIILQLRTNLQNSFFFWSTIPMVFFNDISSPILFFSFFYLNFFEPRANNQLWNFRKSVKSRTNRRRGTLLLSPLARFTRFTHSMEFLRKFFLNVRCGPNESKSKRDFRANRSRDETRLVPFVWHAIDKLVIFSADVNFSSFSPSPFLLRSLSVLCTPTRRSRENEKRLSSGVVSIGMMYQLCSWKRIKEKKDIGEKDSWTIGIFFEEIR